MISRILTHLGGENLKETAPHLYQALSNVQPVPDVRSASGDSAKEIYTSTDEVYSGNEGIGILQRISFLNCAPFVVSVSKLWEKESERLIDTFSEYWEDCVYGESILESTTSLARQAADKNLRLVSTFTWSTDGINVYETTQEFTLEQYVGGNPAVKKIDVADPRAKDGKLTIVLYDREGFLDEKVDYHYTNVMNADNTVKVKMPFSGSLEVSEEFELIGINTTIKDEEPKLSLILENGGCVDYVFDKKKFADYFTLSEDKSKMTWEFDDDWNAVLDLSHFSVKTIVDFSCTFTLNVYKKDNTDFVFHPLIMITSAHEPVLRNSTTVEIEPIQIQWGCLAKGTRIRMADGSEKVIEAICPGDVVAEAAGSAVRVIDIIRGMENSLICLETRDGCQLFLTGSHPVKTERGFLRADELNAADVIHTEHGQSQIKHLYNVNGSYEVFNLMLEHASSIFCSGIIAGDFDMQNGFTRQNTEASSPSAVQLELRKLFGKND